MLTCAKASGPGLDIAPELPGVNAAGYAKALMFAQGWAQVAAGPCASRAA
jgi:hypothetical protein